MAGALDPTWCPVKVPRECLSDTRTSGSYSLALVRPPQPVGSMCDLELSQAELYLDTGARMISWG